MNKENGRNEDGSEKGGDIMACSVSSDERLTERRDGKIEKCEIKGGNGRK